MNVNSLKQLWMQASRNHFLRRILDAMGLKIVPFHLYLEKLSFVDLSHLEPDFEAYDIGFFDEKDIREIADIPGRHFSVEDLMARLKAGHICYGMKYHGEIAAFTWCDPEKCNFRLYSFPIKKHEAYLYDAYTMADHRGKGVAPYLRFRFYDKLAGRGRYNLYSYSLYFDISAVRFKEKLNARRLKLCVNIQVFHKWDFTLTLKRYHLNTPS